LNVPLTVSIYAGPPAGKGYYLPSAGRYLTVQVGSVNCAISSDDNRVHDRLKRIYVDFLTERPADLTIALETKQTHSHVYAAEDEVHSGPAGDESARRPDQHRLLNVDFEWSPAAPDLQFKELNYLLALGYYTVCQQKYQGKPPAMLVHACGILRQGRASVFAGPSDGGKTTIARLCGGNGELINDEMLLISRLDADGYGMNVQGTPMIGGFLPRLNIKAPLGGLFLLKKGNKTQLRPLERIDAYLRFLRQIITPSHIGQTNFRSALSLMADFANEVTGSMPVYELEFNMERDPLWRVIGEFEGTPV